jgi:transketolase
MSENSKSNLANLVEKAREIRSDLFEKMVALQGGHPGSTMSVIDMLVSLYYGGYIRKSETDDIKDRDKIIVSKGHASMGLYPILRDLGYISQEDWNAWGHGPSSLRIFANTSMPGIDATTGSLGHGIGVAAGYALSFKKRGLDRRVYVIISEGELYEGSTWEGLMFAAHHKLDNLVVLLDRNDLIILGNTEDCVALDPIDEKMRAFGYDTHLCDGHDFANLLEELDRATNHKGGPSCIICKTTKGKGFSIMENEPKWHYWNQLTDSETELCRQEIA